MATEAQTTGKSVDFNLIIGSQPTQNGQRNVTLQEASLQVLNRTRDFKEAMKLRSLISKVKAGGVQQLTDDEFLSEYAVFRGLLSEAKIAVYNSLKENGIDLLEYELTLNK